MLMVYDKVADDHHHKTIKLVSTLSILCCYSYSVPLVPQ